MTICTKKNNLLWSGYVNEMISKAYAKLGFMRKCNRYSSQTIYFSFIRPALEYADVISNWDHIPECLSQKIENIQIEAARILTGEINKHPKTCHILKRVGFQYI